MLSDDFLTGAVREFEDEGRERSGALHERVLMSPAYIYKDENTRERTYKYQFIQRNKKKITMNSEHFLNSTSNSYRAPDT